MSSCLALQRLRSAQLVPQLGGSPVLCSLLKHSVAPSGSHGAMLNSFK